MKLGRFLKKIGKLCVKIIHLLVVNQKQFGEISANLWQIMDSYITMNKSSLLLQI